MGWSLPSTHHPPFPASASSHTGIATPELLGRIRETRTWAGSIQTLCLNKDESPGERRPPHQGCHSPGRPPCRHPGAGALASLPAGQRAGLGRASAGRAEVGSWARVWTGVLRPLSCLARCIFCSATPLLSPQPDPVLGPRPLPCLSQAVLTPHALTQPSIPFLPRVQGRHDMLGQQPSVTSILGTDLGSGRLVTSQFQDAKVRCRTVTGVPPRTGPGKLPRRQQS